MSDAPVKCAICGYSTVAGVPACPRCLADMGDPVADHEYPTARAADQPTASVSTRSHRAHTVARLRLIAGLVLALVALSLLVVALGQLDRFDDVQSDVDPQESEITIPDPAPSVSAVSTTLPVP